MDELELDEDRLLRAARHVESDGYALLEIDAESAARLPELLAVPFRRCYVSDDDLARASRVTGLPVDDLLEAKLPVSGSVMSGDFGEILTALLQGVFERPHSALEPKKWRLKQDNTKPTPHTDVVQFVLPDWPQSSSDDRVNCSEVKTKATKGAWAPVPSALADSKKDSDGRLLSTLLWLRKRAMFSPGVSLGTVSLAQLQRFIQATEHPPATHSFRAVVVISSDLLGDELASFDIEDLDGQTLVLVSVSDLKATYEATFAATRATVVREADA